MLLINCSDPASTGLFRPFFPKSLPFGLAFLGARLRESGIPFSILDQQTGKNLFGKIDEWFERGGDALVGLSSLSEALPQAKECAAYIKKKYPKALIIMGGLHASIAPEEVLDLPGVDYAFRGEAETGISALAADVLEGRGIENHPGIIYRKDGQTLMNPWPELLTDLDQCGRIPYDLFDQRNYFLGYIGTSRGCPYDCSFCCNNLVGQKKYRTMSPERVIDELDVLITRYGQHDITFYDDNFLAGKQRVYTICELIRKQKWHGKVSFMLQARAKDADPEILAELKSSGFNSVFFGIEAASEKLLKEIGKRETIADITRAVTDARKTGFKVMANFLYGLPGETYDDRMACVDFSLRNRIDVVKFNNVVPYPGTRMFGELRYSRQFFMSAENRNINSQLVLVKPFFKKTVFPLLPEGTGHQALRMDILLSYLLVYYNLFRWISMLRKRNWGGILFKTGKSRASVLWKSPRLFILAFDLVIKILLLGPAVLLYGSGAQRKAAFRVAWQFFKKHGSG